MKEPLAWQDDTDNGFHLKTGFKKRFSPQTMVLVLNLVSQKKFSTQTIPLAQPIYYQFISKSRQNNL